MKRTFSAVSACFLAAALGCGGGAEKDKNGGDKSGLRLTPKFKAGESRRYRLVSEKETVAVSEGGPLKTKVREVQYELVDARELERTLELDSAGNARLEYGIVEARIVHDDGAKLVRYDLTSKADVAKIKEPYVKALASMVGRTVTFRLDKDLNVSEFQGFSGTEVAEAAERIDPKTKEALKREISGSALGKSLEARYRSFFPDRALKVGDTWEGRVALSEALAGLSGASMVYRYKLAKVEPSGSERIAVIEFTIDVEGMKETKTDTMTLTPGKSGGKGTIKFAVNGGYPTFMRAEVKLRFTRVRKTRKGDVTTEVTIRHGFLNELLTR